MKLPGVLLKEKGSALFPTIMLVIVIFIIGIAVLEITAIETRISLNHANGMEALYLAEAGIQMAINQLEHNPNWKEGYKNYPLGSGVIKSVELRPLSDPNTVRLEAQAEVRGVGRRIRVELAKIPVPFNTALETDYLILGPGVRLAIAGDAIHHGDLTLGSQVALEGYVTVGGTVRIAEATVKGALSAVGPIMVEEQAFVAGDLVSSGEISCLGDIAPGYAAFPFTPILKPLPAPATDLSWYDLRPHMLIEDDIILAGELDSGIYLANGDLTITNDDLGNTYAGQIAVVAHGQVVISGDLLPLDPKRDSLMIFAEDIMVGEGATEVWAALLAEQTINIRGGLREKTFWGTIQAPRVIFSSPGSTKVNYYPFSGVQLVKKPKMLFRIITWLEILLR